MHTPGPWTATEHGVVAEHCTSHGNFYVCGLIDPDNEEDKANARLIAAAPELLTALQDLVNACEYWEDQDDSVLVSARDAIAKATGCES